MKMTTARRLLNATYSDVTVAGACEGTWVITRTWSLVDDCGNAAADQLQTITVSDNTPPTFTRPPDDVICRNSDCTYNASVSVTGDVTDENDNCSIGINATYSDDATGAVNCDSAGIIIRTWSLIDKCGNVAIDQIQTIM